MLLPTVAVDKVTDITPELIHAMKANSIILDVDNTLALHGSPEPLEGTVEWVHYMRSKNIHVIIMSNNIKKRVAPFAKKYDLPFLYLSLKPVPVAYHLAARRMGVRPRDAVVVGDQIFTDVIGANLAWMKSILLKPVCKEKSLSFTIRRNLEKPIRDYIKRSKWGSKYLK